MARQYQKQRVTRIEYKCTTLCDICKEPIVNNDPYREDEVTIEAKIGRIYPDGDSRDCFELDCCVDCFIDKVRPLLERELGVKFRERDAEDYGPRGGECTVEKLDS